MSERVSFCLGIPHTPWVPARVDSLRSLMGCLESPELMQVFSDREPNWAWSERMWNWALSQRASHFLTLQDDALIAPNFWKHLHAMVSAAPDAVIGLEAAHPRGLEIEGHWYTTPDMLIGVGYVVPMTILSDFVTWRRTKLRKGAVESINEDTLLGVYCLATGKRIWHPVPTIIDHDVELKSTYGNDKHGHRRPSVTWKNAPVPEQWSGSPVYLGRFYEATPRLARRWIVDATEEDYQRWLAV